MKYGDWQLNENDAYYPSQSIVVYPSSNSVDKGMLHTEDNVRAIVRRITSKSYKLKDNHFAVTIINDRKTVQVGEGEANIQGYHVSASGKLSLNIPHTVDTTPLTLGLSLAYDAANNVTGDVIINGEELGTNEYFSGVYLKFFDSCTLRQNYDNILVLGRAWVKDGQIVPDGTEIKDEPGNPYNNTYLRYGFEPDPLNDNAVAASTVEVNVEGATLCAYDALQSKQIPNMDSTLAYAGTTKYESELNPAKFTKPPTFTTDLQNYLNYMVDWYPSKFGDYMTGALRFDPLSTDAKRELDSDHATEYTKDAAGTAGTKGKYHFTESVFISPRPLGHLTDRDSSSLASIDLNQGGTVMSVVPQSYAHEGIDSANQGPIYVAMRSSNLGDTGIQIRSKLKGISHLSHINGTDNLLLENKHNSGNISSMYFEDGEIFIDSYNAAGVQIHAVNSVSNAANSVAFRFDATKASVISHLGGSHRLSASGSANGSNSDTLHIQYGLGSNYAGQITSITDEPYLRIGGLQLRSNDVNAVDKLGISQQIPTIDAWASGTVESAANTKYPFIHRAPNQNDSFSYIRMLPGLYTPNILTPDYIQIGATDTDDIIRDNAIANTHNRVLIYKHTRTDEDQNTAYTAIEQDFSPNAADAPECQIMNMLTPFTEAPTGDPDEISSDNKGNHNNTYREIGGIYSYGNIGASSAMLKSYSGRRADDGPYQDNAEWVRFTRFRYDRDQDKIYGGTYEGTHARTYGDAYNIEFNTNKSNQRANQIIWNYKGSNSHQPLTLSYIHDDTTAYPNPEYYDHNMYKHQNPTFGVRDFLRIDGGGLSIHGDTNNPTLAGDENNTHDRFGMTLIQGRVYSSVYNDYAETYEKADISEQAVEGMVVMLDAESGKYKICNEEESSLVVGVISDNYGMLIGGKSIDSARSHEESVLQINDFAVGVSGKLIVNVIENNIEPGDLLVSASKPGLAKAIKDRQSIIPGTVIGKALSKSQPVDGTDYYKCLMQIMLA